LFQTAPLYPNPWIIEQHSFSALSTEQFSGKTPMSIKMVLEKEGLLVPAFSPLFDAPSLQPSPL
jgi:hypothetical protein